MKRDFYEKITLHKKEHKKSVYKDKENTKYCGSWRISYAKTSITSKNAHLSIPALFSLFMENFVVIKPTFYRATYLN